MTHATITDRGEANKATIEQTIEVVWNRGDWSHGANTYRDDIVVHSPTEPEPLVGREFGWKRLWDQLHTAYPDFRMDIEDIFAECDKVSVRFRVTGTNTGDYFGMKATGKPIDVTELAVFHFRDTKVAEIWFGMDTMEIGRQLGLVPPGPPPAALIAFMRFTQRVGGAFKRKPRTAAMKAQTWLVHFECGHDAHIFEDEHGDGSAWCQACGEFRSYDVERSIREHEVEEPEARSTPARMLTFTEGPLTGRRIDVTEELVVGRYDAGLTIDDAQISRRHAVFRVVEEGLEIEDLGSLNGTRVNDLFIDSPTRLVLGDVVQLGESSLEISSADAVPAASGSAQ